MATINARTHEIVARSNRQAKKNERNNRNRANRTWQVSALWLMYTISMYSNAISLIVKWSWYDCMWNNISIQSRCNRSLSFGSKCHYSTRFSLFCLSFDSPCSTLHHTSDFIIFINRCSHFHAIILPFSVIYLLFGHFSYVVRFKFSFFIHSFDLFCKTFPFDLPPSTFSAHTNTSMYIFCVVFRFSVKISITFQCDL